MVERRLHERQRLDARVRLYHPVFGSIDGMMRDMSSGGMFISLEQIPDVHPKNGNSRFQCGMRNMDVVFDVSCVRTSNDGIGLIFVEGDSEDNMVAVQ